MPYTLTPEQEAEAVDLLLKLLGGHVKEKPREPYVRPPYCPPYANPRAARKLRNVDPAELVVARKIAADTSRQTGKNYAKFINGDYDHAYGVQCALAGMAAARGEG